ncbi:hypothetical protein [Pandoraea pnomenusa]|uniref:hypothetical protein n=1 Tax=Pandoraea pnomenusa TaxID=93220 RepID=UPI003342B959
MSQREPVAHGTEVDPCVPSLASCAKMMSSQHLITDCNIASAVDARPTGIREHSGKFETGTSDDSEAAGAFDWRAAKIRTISRSAPG